MKTTFSFLTSRPHCFVYLEGKVLEYYSTVVWHGNHKLEPKICQTKASSGTIKENLYLSFAFRIEYKTF